MKPVSAIFFDLDNTLFDHHHSSVMGLSALQSQFSALQKHPLATLEKHYYDLLNDNYHRILSGSISMDAARHERMRRYLADFGIELNDLEVATAVSDYRQAYRANLRVVPNTIEVLNALYGRLQLGIITNGLVTFQNQKIEQLNLQSYFDTICISEAIGSKKPEAHIYETALQQLNASPETAVMVGDSWQADIIGSTQAGLTAVWLNRFNEDHPTPQNVHKINHLKELITTIEGR